MNQTEFISSFIPLRERLLHKALQLTAGDDVAEDIVQETMLSLWNMRDRLDSHPNHEALAMTMVRNKFTDMWRRRRLEVSQRAEATELSCETTYEWSDEAELIKKIIDHLPPLQSTIMRMKEIENYENEEIAQIVGCSTDNIRQNLSRARKKVREEFIKQTMRK